MALTAVAVKNAKPDDKPYKLFDSGGLYLLVKPNKSKLWRWKYRINGKEKTLSIGAYPTISLSEARQTRNAAREQLQDGIDPSKAKKNTIQVNTDNSFEGVAREWFDRYLSEKSESHYRRTVSYMERDVFPKIGYRPIGDIKPPELIAVIDDIHKRVARDSHLRTLQSIGQVMRYAIMTGRRTDPDPTPSLKGLFPPREPKNNFPAITDPVEVARLLRAIEYYAGNPITKCALQLSPLVMVRPSELIKAEWSEIDFNKALWTVEAKRMKLPTMLKKANRAEDGHIVPLSSQALEVLKKLQPITGASRYVFQSPASRGGQDAPMSSETVSKAIHRMGFKGQMTAHGFRAMADSLLNEMRDAQGRRVWDADAIERQLAHKERNVVKAAYNRAAYLQERKQMMQAWADYLDKLKAGGDVVPIRAGVGAGSNQ